jgi:cytosine/uracil/thiamine/allantoin permease
MSREAQTSAAAHWTLYLEFHNIKRALGLSTAALIAFVAGLACLVMAGVAVGMIYSVQTFNDFQAVQLYRMQWLLGAIAAFAAGLLLKKKPDTKP